MDINDSKIMSAILSLITPTKSQIEPQPESQPEPQPENKLVKTIQVVSDESINIVDSIQIHNSETLEASNFDTVISKPTDTVQEQIKFYNLVYTFIKASVPVIIVADGPIAVGKTTAMNKIRERFSDNKMVVVLEESAMKPHLEKLRVDYYADPKKGCYAFHRELFNEMKTQQEQAIKLYREGHIVIMDRCLMSMLPFVRYNRSLGNLNMKQFHELELLIIDTFYNLIENDESLSDKGHFIYNIFDVSPVEAKNNTKSRGRDSEQSLPIEFFIELDKYFKTVKTNFPCL